MKNGTADIKEHAWFEGFSWQDCYDRKTLGPFPIEMRCDLMPPAIQNRL